MLCPLDTGGRGGMRGERGVGLDKVSYSLFSAGFWASRWRCIFIASADDNEQER
jgi:hypothetical protein